MADDFLDLRKLVKILIECDPSDSERLFNLQRRSTLIPEKCLLLAILHYAYFELTSSVEYVRREAADWIMLDNDYVCGFLEICQALEISPTVLRRNWSGLLEPALKSKGRPSRIAIAAPIPHDEKASHEYVGSQHCRECRDRYHRWYKQNGPVKRGKAA